MPNIADDVTLVCIDSHHADRAAKVLQWCESQIHFKSILLFSSQEFSSPYLRRLSTPITSLQEYSRFCIKELHQFIETSHLLLVQHDGWICNSQAWTDDWLSYDYIGCETVWTSPGEDGQGGNGGFSLRSLDLMKAADALLEDFDPEDQCLSQVGSRGHTILTEQGFKFAPRCVQRRFGVEYQYWNGQFGHHRSRILGRNRLHAGTLTTLDIQVGKKYDYSNADQVLWTFLLGHDGRINGPHHSNETFWSFENGLLLLMDESKYINAVFDSVSRHGVLRGVWRDGGPHFLSPHLESADMSLMAMGGQCDTHKGTQNSYLSIYERMFEGIREEALSIMEIGVENGCSAKMLLKYFPQATLHGVDVSIRSNVEQDPRLTLHQLDGTDQESLMKFPDNAFDIIIDDASHQLASQLLSLKHLWRCLKPGGLYFVESIQSSKYVCLFDGYGPTESHLLMKGGRPDDILVAIRKDGSESVCRECPPFSVVY